MIDLLISAQGAGGFMSKVFFFCQHSTEISILFHLTPFYTFRTFPLTLIDDMQGTGSCNLIPLPLSTQGPSPTEYLKAFSIFLNRDIDVVYKFESSMVLFFIPISVKAMFPRRSPFFRRIQCKNKITFFCFLNINC